MAEEKAAVQAAAVEEKTTNLGQAYNGLPNLLKKLEEKNMSKCNGCNDSISAEEIKMGSKKDLCVACEFKTPEERKERRKFLIELNQRFPNPKVLNEVSG